MKKLLEVISLLSVIVSLLVVGYELRQSTDIARSETYQLFMFEADLILPTAYS